MIEKKELNKIKETVEEFFEKMTIEVLSIDIATSTEKAETEENRDIVDLDIKLAEPQILIGQGGQTLFEIQRLLRNVLNKQMGKIFFINLDINDYKRNKISYLKDLAKELADQVASSKIQKAMLPMSSYERRVVHAELAQRTDVTTDSQGEGFDRHIVIKAK